MADRSRPDRNYQFRRSWSLPTPSPALVPVIPSAAATRTVSRSTGPHNGRSRSRFAGQPASIDLLISCWLLDELKPPNACRIGQLRFARWHYDWLSLCAAVNSRAHLADAINGAVQAGAIGTAILLSALYRGEIAHQQLFPGVRWVPPSGSFGLIGDDDGADRGPSGWPAAPKAIAWGPGDRRAHLHKRWW